MVSNSSLITVLYIPLSITNCARYKETRVIMITLISLPGPVGLSRPKLFLIDTTPLCLLNYFSSLSRKSIPMSSFQVKIILMPGLKFSSLTSKLIALLAVNTKIICNFLFSKLLLEMSVICLFKSFENHAALFLFSFS